MSKARNLSLLSTVEAGATTDQTKADIEGLGIAVGSSQMPAGSVINTFEYHDSGSSSMSAGATKFSHTLGTATGTSALTSASNKLLVVCSFDIAISSQSSLVHWRVRFTCTGFTSEYIEANWGYQINTYQQERLVFNALITPGTATPTIAIEFIEAVDGGTLTSSRGHFSYQEVQA